MIYTYKSHSDDIIETIKRFSYQEELTKKLDSYQGDFSDEIINEIVLWKVNRYVTLECDALKEINTISPHDDVMDLQKSKNILAKLLRHKGVRLPMASTILRFRNAKIYQIVDQRVYRFITGAEIQYPKEIEAQVEFYFEYLALLKQVCIETSVAFEEADRVFYVWDKDMNGKIKY
jgi:signal recognition particle subunit SEC65